MATPAAAWRAGGGRVAPPPRDQPGRMVARRGGRLGDLEPPERLDLPLRGTVPDGVGPEDDPVLTEESQPHAEDVRTNRRERDHGRGERRAQLAVDVVDVREPRRSDQKARRPEDVRHRRATVPSLESRAQRPARLDIEPRVQHPESWPEARV